MDRGGDKTLLLSADEDDFEPELSDRGHQSRDDRPSSQARNTESYCQDYYDYGDWASADQREHYAMEGRGQYHKNYDDDDDTKHEVDSPPPYSEDTPPRREQTYSHNYSAATPNNYPHAHNYTYAPPTYTPTYTPTTQPTTLTYTTNDNWEQNQPQPPPYVQSYWDNPSIVNSSYWRDDPTPQRVAQSTYGAHAPWPQTPEEPYQDVPTYKICSVLILIFCCLPLGVAGLVYSSRAENLKAERKYTQAKIVAKKAKPTNIVGLVFGVFIWVVNGVFFYFKFKYLQQSY